MYPSWQRATRLQSGNTHDRSWKGLMNRKETSGTRSRLTAFGTLHVKSATTTLSRHLLFPTGGVYTSEDIPVKKYYAAT